MDLEKIYYDQDGNECNILELVKQAPEWAAERIQVGEAAIYTLECIAASKPAEADAGWPRTKCSGTGFERENTP